MGTTKANSTVVAPARGDREFRFLRFMVTKDPAKPEVFICLAFEKP